MAREREAGASGRRSGRHGPCPEWLSSTGTERTAGARFPPSPRNGASRPLPPLIPPSDATKRQRGSRLPLIKGGRAGGSGAGTLCAAPSLPRAPPAGWEGAEQGAAGTRNQDKDGDGGTGTPRPKPSRRDTKRVRGCVSLSSDAPCSPPLPMAVAEVGRRDKMGTLQCCDAAACLVSPHPPPVCNALRVPRLRTSFIPPSRDHKHCPETLLYLPFHKGRKKKDHRDLYLSYQEA